MSKWFSFAMVAFAVACGVEGAEGDACETDDDCGDELHCHIEDGGGICEGDHEDHEGEDHEGEEHEGEDHDDEGTEE